MGRRRRGKDLVLYLCRPDGLHWQLPHLWGGLAKFGIPGKASRTGQPGSLDDILPRWRSLGGIGNFHLVAPVSDWGRIAPDNFLISTWTRV